MPIENDIEQLAADLMPNYTFFFASTFNFNQIIHNSEPSDFPVMVLFNDLNEQVTIGSNANALTATNIMIGFYDPSMWDDDDETKNDIIQLAKFDCKRFFGALWRNNAVKENAPVFDIDVVQTVTSGPITGVIGTAKWKYQEIIPLCLTEAGGIGSMQIGSTFVVS